MKNCQKKKQVCKSVGLCGTDRKLNPESWENHDRDPSLPHIPEIVVGRLEHVDNVDLLDAALGLELHIDLHEALALDTLVNQVHVRFQQLRILNS
jgi:hypothetical protein